MQQFLCLSECVCESVVKAEAKAKAISHTKQPQVNRTLINPLQGIHDPQNLSQQTKALLVVCSSQKYWEQLRTSHLDRHYQTFKVSNSVSVSYQRLIKNFVQCQKCKDSNKYGQRFGGCKVLSFGENLNKKLRQPNHKVNPTEATTNPFPVFSLSFPLPFTLLSLVPQLQSSNENISFWIKQSCICVENCKRFWS